MWRRSPSRNKWWRRCFWRMKKGRKRKWRDKWREKERVKARGKGRR